MLYLKCYYKYYYITLLSIFLVLCLNVYLVFFFSKDESSIGNPSIIKYNATYSATQNIMNSLSKLDKEYDVPVPTFQSNVLRELNVLLSNLKLKINGDIDLFAATIKVMNQNGLMPLHGTPYLGSTINLLKTSKITKTYNAFKGTQLKLILMFENKQEVLFKPKWYLESEIIEGSVYAGKDRYNGEIIAFYISLILGFPRVPIVVKRILDASELHETANIGLKKTMYINSTTKETCVYGKCYYCKREDPICTKSERLEGAAIFHLPSNIKLTQHLHPWRRTYIENKKARWEDDNDYCDSVKSNYNSERVLDFIDVSIFDFIIGNGDRHRYEVMEQFNNTILLIDNGKSFGNPYKDHIDILAPLYQCCIIRLKTWQRLKSIKGGTFTNILQSMLDIHETLSLLTLPHYHALERRLKIIYATVVMCQRKSDKSILK
ncbi:glycosaminoglycan xylosylkinase [Rhopalosiphum maidis]|uniref:glycosaminoglycan xylosylkinase n=1 Tax=Rhopalosiphum maidis TaxID=43146 RepID=UPI000EFEE197|nr:glycosaminoglycan xylosylkinase [Rhopalosiphum maidis]